MQITLAAIPAYGHVLPLVPLAVAAARAGHTVTFAASDEFAGRLPVPVVQSIPQGMRLHDAEQETRREIPDPGDPMAFPTAMFGVVLPRHIRPRLLTHWAEHGRPDLVIYEGSNIGAAAAAAEVGVRSVSFNISLAPPEFFLERLATVSDVDLAGPLIDPTPALWRLPDPAGMPRIPIRSVAWSDGPRVESFPDRPANHSGPRAYLTLGTVAFGAVEVLRRSILETANVCRQVLVAAGPSADLAALGALPDHVQVERYVHQPSALERADVAVHHGGSGTLLACLAAGVPQVITPQGADQFMNAEQLARLDVGAVVHNDAPQGSVAAAVRHVLTDEALHRSVTAIRDQISTMPSPDEVVETLTRR